MEERTKSAGSLAASHICKDVYGKGRRRIRLLDDISFVLEPGEMVAIIGSSGAGKSTLINCLNGSDRPTSGKVFLNGHDMAEDHYSVRGEIGWVPQSDIVHGDLKVRSMLRYAVRLRTKERMDERQTDEKIEEVLDAVGLAAHGDTLIRKLSGGERKRAGIASELINSPSLFFLDEPTSGLDPEAETGLMKQLRRLSDKMGKTIVCITHTLQNISLFDKIVFLAPGGRMCFFGSHADSLAFFGVDNLVDAYERVSADVPGYIEKYRQMTEGRA